MVERNMERSFGQWNGHTGVSFYGGTKEQTLMITDGGLCMAEKRTSFRMFTMRSNECAAKWIRNV